MTRPPRAARLAFALLATAACSRPAPPDPTRTPVLFVHGSGVDAEWTWSTMLLALRDLGHPASHLDAVDLVPNAGPNARAAERFVAPAVEALLERAAAAARAAGEDAPSRVDLVAHSMGAVSARIYASALRPERVRTLIALAGANHGSDALCGLPGEGNEEMCPAFAASREESGVQVALNGTPGAPRDETPYGLGPDRAGVAPIPPSAGRAIAYFAVWIDPDRWIRPAESALLDGTGGVAVSIPPGVPATVTQPGSYRLDGDFAHETLPHDHDVIRLVAAILSARDRR